MPALITHEGVYLVANHTMIIQFLNEQNRLAELNNKDFSAGPVRFVVQIVTYLSKSLNL